MLVYLSLIDSEEAKSKFEIIYNEYNRLMLYVADQILRDNRDSEDVVHEAFIKIIENIDKISNPQCPQTRNLVVTIVERKAINLYWRRKRKVILPLEDSILSSTEPDPANHIAGGSVVAHAMASLPANYRDILLLKFDGGYSNAEIAAFLDMTESNVKKTVQRAKNKLRTALENMGEEV